VVESGWVRKGDHTKGTFRMRTEATINDYAIAVWNVPADGDRLPGVETNAKDAVLVRNTDGEVHLVLSFDLKPDCELAVTLRPASPGRPG
jgi:hypothetical protein